MKLWVDILGKFKNFTSQARSKTIQWLCPKFRLNLISRTHQFPSVFNRGFLNKLTIFQLLPFQLKFKAIHHAIKMHYWGDETTILTKGIFHVTECKITKASLPQNGKKCLILIWIPTEILTVENVVWSMNARSFWGVFNHKLSSATYRLF